MSSNKTIPLSEFLRSANPFISESGSDPNFANVLNSGYTRTSDEQKLNSEITRIGAPAVFNQYFGPNSRLGPTLQSRPITLSPDGQSVTFNPGDDGTAEFFQTIAIFAAMAGGAAMASGAIGGAAGAEGAAGATGAFDTAGWAGTGLEGSMGIGNGGASVLGGSGGNSSFGGMGDTGIANSYNPSDPFNFAGDVGPNLTNVGSGGGVENFLPGGQFSQYGAGGGMVDLGGAGAVAGVDIGGAGVSGLSNLTNSNDIIEETGNFTDSKPGTNMDWMKGFPFGAVLGGVLSAYGASQNRDDLKGYLDKALDYADPFHDQRKGYQDQFPGVLDYFKNTINDQNKGYQDLSRGLNTGFNDLRSGYDSGYKDLFQGYKTTSDRFQDPNYWNKDSLLAGLNTNATNDVSRYMAANGYNNSGNMLSEISGRLQNNNATYVPAFMNSYNQGATGYLNSYTNNANSNLGAYNTNAGNQLQGYNNNANSNIQGAGNYTDMIGTAAGYKMGSGGAGDIVANLGSKIAGTNQNIMGGLGSAFQSAFANNDPSNYSLAKLFGLV